MSKEEKVSLWSERIQKFRSSGQTCKNWCTDNHIPISTMTYWMRRLTQNEETLDDVEPVFAKLPSESEIAQRDAVQSPTAVNIWISSCVRIEVSPSCPLELFRGLIRTLKENA